MFEMKNGSLTCDDVFCHLGLFSVVFFLLLFELPGETEIAEAYLAILTCQDVGGFDVPMHNRRRVEEVEALEELVHDVFDVLVSEVFAFS
jgi:hypothetical protein